MLKQLKEGVLGDAAAVWCEKKVVKKKIELVLIKNYVEYLNIVKVLQRASYTRLTAKYSQTSTKMRIV